MEGFPPRGNDALPVKSIGERVIGFQAAAVGLCVRLEDGHTLCSCLGLLEIFLIRVHRIPHTFHALLCYLYLKACR